MNNENIVATPKRRAKKRLKDFDFSGDNSSVSLVGPSQGGAANNFQVLAIKSNFSDEFVQKMQQIRVTLELPEFLRRFFNMYGEDAEVLARMMGYEKPEGSDAVEPIGSDMEYEDYIQSRLQAYEIMKSVHEADNLVNALAALDETEYLAMLEDQVILEKALLQQTDDSAIEIEDQSVNSTNASVEKSVEPSGSELKQLEKSHMTEEVNKEASPAEMIEKSAFESVQKAFEEQKEKLEKALESIAQFEAEKKAAIAKAKTAQVQEVIKDEARTAVLAKAALALESEDDFGAFVSALKDMMATAEQSDMFVEKGASVSDDTPAIKESAVAKALKAKLNK